VLAGVALGLAQLACRPLNNDANFILFSFIRSLIRGNGLIYPSAIGPVTTYPLGALLVAVFGSDGDHLILGTWIVCALASAVGALALSTLTGRRWLAVGSYVLLSALSPSPVVLVMLALTLAGIVAARLDRWLWAGVLLGLAILTEPSAIFPAVLLVLLSLRQQGTFWRYALPVVIIPLVGLSTLELTLQMRFGAQPIPIVSIVPSIISVTLPALALWSLARNWAILQENPVRAILVSWSAFEALIALLHGTWPGFVIIPGALVLALSLPARYPVVLAVAFDLILNMALPANQNVATEHSIGEWIAANTPAQSTLATVNIGALAYYAQRPVIDLSGKLQITPFDKDFFLRTAPDTIVLDESPSIVWAGFKTTYSRQYSVGGLAVYRRVVNFTPLLPVLRTDQPFAGNLGRSDLRLEAFAVASSANPGDLIRVRLDWQLAYTPTHEIAIALSLRDSTGKVVAQSLDKLPTGAWHLGSISTYHALVLPGNTPEEALTLKLSVAYSNGDLGSQDIATLMVVKPPAP